ncbi:MAG: hypothetical protein JHC54_10935, partial [Acinetobacter sp.]|nr:hypothetical protein [Acinetobacter sp.]
TQTGSSVNLNVPGIDPNLFSSGNVYVVPNTEEIEVAFLPSGIDIFNQATVKQICPISEGVAYIAVSIPNDTSYLYNVKYRYKNGSRYSSWKTISSDTIGFYNETSFDQRGVLNANIVDRTRTPYVSNSVNGFIPVLQNGNSYKNVIDSIDKGDFREVRVRALSNAVPVVELFVGVDEWVQVFNNNLSFATDMVISLKRTGIKNGNVFKLIFSGPITSNLNSFKIQDNYVNPGDPGITLFEFTATDFSWMSLPNKKVAIECWTDGTKWYSWVAEKDPSKLGDIVMRDSLDATLFDGTGKGIGGDFFGWAICNGQNTTPDLRDRMIISYDARTTNPGNNIWDAAYSTIGSVGGNKNIQLDVGNLPAHTHPINSDGSHVHPLRFGTGGSGSGVKDASYDSSITDKIEAAGAHNHGGATGSTGSGTAIDIRPPFYVLAFLKRIF